MTRRELFLSSFLGLLIVAFGQPSFAPWLAPVAGAVGYTLFWRCARIFPLPLQRFWRGVLWYTAVSLVQLSWMASYEYQGAYIILVFAGLSLWLGLQFGLLTLLIPYGKIPSIPRALAIASLWTLFEWGRFYFICGFTWNLSGLALSQKYAVQMASIGGILGLSFWVIFTNLLGLRALLKKRGPYYGSWIACAAIPYLFGAFYVSYHDRRGEKSSPFNCVLVQTGLLPPEKVLLKGKFQAFISPYDQWGHIFAYINECRGVQTDLVVLPEAALPFTSTAPVYQKARVQKVFFEAFGVKGEQFIPNRELLTNGDITQALADTLNTEVVIGLDHCGGDGTHYNSAFHSIPGATALPRYDKQVLMPLAEYLPYAFLRPLVASYGITDFFTPGNETRLFKGALPMAVSICYEETFPDAVRKGRQLGAELLVNVSNDGWYPFTRLPSQHYEHARLRAVENGVPLVRACNTGVTAAVDSLGRELGRLAELSGKKKINRGALAASVPTYTHKTLFSKWGNWGIVSLSSLFILAFGFFRKTFKW